jgi:hypothetical protein
MCDLKANFAFEFLCPRYRATLCDMTSKKEEHTDSMLFLCPRFRTALYDLLVSEIVTNAIRYAFLCPRIRTGLCDLEFVIEIYGMRNVSMPSVSGWGFATLTSTRSTGRSTCFYALSIGLGFSTLPVRDPNHRCRGSALRPHVWREYFQLQPFLCPRYRAGVSDYLDNAWEMTCVQDYVFLCPRYRAGLFDCSDYYVRPSFRRFLCPPFRAGLCGIRRV